MNKEETYQFTVTQIRGLLEGETNLTSNLANIAAVLKENHKFFWVGFYLVEEQQLVLGPFQGPVACSRIDYGKGVCGTSWKEKKSIVVPDVHQFPGHIACSSESRSEIVLPLFNTEHGVFGVLDVDSKEYSDFDEVDEMYLTQVTHLIGMQHEK